MDGNPTVYFLGGAGGGLVVTLLIGLPLVFRRKS